MGARRVAGFPRWGLLHSLMGLMLWSGCGNECQKLCVRMYDLFDECGVATSRDELQTCQNLYHEVTEQQEAQCAAQTEELMVKNLALKSGQNDMCLELAKYQP